MYLQLQENIMGTRFWSRAAKRREKNDLFNNGMLRSVVHLLVGLTLTHIPTPGPDEFMALMRTINESSFRDLVESGQMSERELAYVEPKFGQGDAAKAKRAREAERAEAAKVSIACKW